MDSMPAHRTSWKIRLVAFGIGIIIAAAIFGIALVISEDLRLLYLSGGLLLAVAAFLLTAKAPEDWIGAVLLLFASTFLFAFFVLPQTPFLWPTPLLWAAIVALLLFRKRFGNDQNWRRHNTRRGFSLVLCFVYPIGNAARVNASER
jgi:hypothetical protein